MVGLKKRAVAVLSVAALLISGLTAIMIPASALTETPSNSDPVGVTAYLDEYFNGQAGEWSGDINQNTMFGNYAWRYQYYDPNPDWHGFYNFKNLRAKNWGGSGIDEYLIGKSWYNDKGQFNIQGGIPYIVTDHSDPTNVICFTYVAPKAGLYNIHAADALKDVAVMYPKYFPGGSDYNDGQYVSAGSTFKIGFAIHKMSNDCMVDDGVAYDPAASTRIWPTNKNYEYLTKETLSFAFPTINNVQLKAGECLRFIIDASECDGIEDWLLSAKLYPTVEPAKIDQSLEAMTGYADTYLGGVAGNWSGDINMDDLMPGYAWRAQYYDVNPEWHGFYNFKHIRGISWGSGSIDSYKFGKNWKNDVGQFDFQGGVPYVIADQGESTNVLSLTFTAPKDGRYNISGDDKQPNIKVMYPQYFPGGSDYNEGQYVPAASTFKIGFAIHKMSNDCMVSDSVTYDPTASTRIWPTGKNYEYLTKDTLSFAFPTLSNIELKEGERLRFIFDAGECSGVEDWLLSASWFPCVVLNENSDPVAEDASVVCTIGKAVNGQLVAADSDKGDTVTFALKDQASKGTAVVNTDGTYTYTANSGVSGEDTFTFTATDSHGASDTATVTVTLVSNQKPTASALTFSTLENNPLSGDISTADADGETVTATVKTPTEHGKLTLQTDGSFTYLPDTDYSGADSATITLSDGIDTVDVVLSLTVEKNEAPVAENINTKTIKDQPKTVTVKATDANGATLTYAIATKPAHGTVDLQGDQATYTPAAGYLGSDSFTYTANDGVNTSEPATVSVMVLNTGINSVTTIKDAIATSGDGVDFEKPFDMADVVYDLPWRFQYRIDGITLDYDDETIVRFETAIAGKIFDWGGWVLGDGNTYPTNTIQKQGQNLVNCLNSGYIADSQNPIAALAFVSPKDATWFISGSELSDEFGIWPGQASENPIRIWIEADDGTIVWPANGKPLALDKDTEKVTMPDITIAMKQGAALRFCAAGTTANGDHNNIYLAPEAFELGAYDEKLDPTVAPEDPDDGDDDDDDDPVSPKTGDTLPAIAFAVLAMAIPAAVAADRKRRAR